MIYNTAQYIIYYFKAPTRFLASVREMNGVFFLQKGIDIILAELCAARRAGCCGGHLLFTSEVYTDGKHGFAR